MLSVWWPVGQLIGSLLAWAFIPNFSCTSYEGCTKEKNMGWRYLVLTLGAITFVMFILRFFCFHLYESPKFLLSRGRQEEAVASVHGIAYKNGAKTWLTNDILNEIGGHAEVHEKETGLTYSQIVGRFFSKFSMERIAPLFANKRMGWNTALLWFCWTTIGMGYPLFNAFLPQYLSQSGGETNSNYITYRNYAITSIVGLPGSILDRRNQVRWSQGHHGHFHPDHWRVAVLLHHIHKLRHPAPVQLSRGLLPEHHVRCPLRLYP
jgi:MFS family permease